MKLECFSYCCRHNTELSWSLTTTSDPLALGIQIFYVNNCID